MRSSKYSTVEERNIIVNLHNQVKSLSEISKIVNKPKSTIKGIIDRFGSTKTLENQPKTGRPSVLKARNKRFIIRKIKINPKVSAQKVTEDLEKYQRLKVSSETVRKAIRDNGFHSRTARKKFFVSKVNKRKRLQFAKEYINKPVEYWHRWVFTDESKFNISGSDGNFRVWRLPNTELEPKNMIGTVKHGGGSVMVWGCMSAKGVGNLQVVDGIMDQYKYINILKNNLQSSIIKMELPADYIFQQDNDPKHCAINTKLWLLYNTPKYVPTPPQSPDLNPIEHVWAELDKRIRKHHITNKTELKKVLIEEWKSISPEFTKNLVESMPRRLTALLKSKGYPTKY